MTDQRTPSYRHQHTIVVHRDGMGGWSAHRSIKPGMRAMGGTLEQALSGLIAISPEVFQRGSGYELVVLIAGKDLEARS
jgi:hypothetical protein